MAETVPGSDACLAHATKEDRGSFLATVTGREDGFGNLLRYLSVGPPLLAELLAVITSLDEPVSFFGASFPAAVGFGDVVFHREAVFDGAVFEEDARFSNATFKERASFVGAIFRGNAQFGPGADLASQSGWKTSHGATFQDDVDFGAAEFEGDALFEYVTVGGHISFNRADFHGECRIDIYSYWVTAQQQATLEEAELHAATIARIEANRKIDLTDVRFRDGGIIGLPAGEIDATDLEFGDATRLELEGTLILDSVSSPYPLIIFNRYDGERHQAEIVSLQRSALQAPVIVGSHVGLHRCQFRDSQGLEWLRLPGGTLPLCTHMNRWALADEVIWRGSRSRSWIHRLAERGLVGHRGRWSTIGEDIRRAKAEVAPNPRAIAGLYRQLRKGLEEAKNAPGAADLYYGEMEMRRAGASSRSEAATLWLYWVLSGYGLRAWRALTVLISVITLTAFAFHHLPEALREPCPPGDECREFDSLGATIVFVLRWSISLPTPDIQGVSTSGTALLVTVRVISPILAALTILAIRARVHR